MPRSPTNPPTDARRAVARGRALADKALLLASVGMTVGASTKPSAALAPRANSSDQCTVDSRARGARIYVSVYDIDVARPYLAEAADLARELGDSWWLGQILDWQAIGGASWPATCTATVAAASEGLELAE